MRIPFLFFITLFFFSTHGFSQTEDLSSVEKIIDFTRQTKLAEDRAWLRLLHFQRTWFRSQESAIASPVFFVSENGKKDAAAELEAYLRGLFSEDKVLIEEDSLQCRFPARYRYLKEKLSPLKIEWPDRVCPNFDRWFQTLRGTSASLVFSSYFLNNPSSTFGHTLLRINKAPSAKDGQRYQLLDYGVNYAANAEKVNALLYAFNGLFGGFPGTFTTMPYYYKVREYSNAESRDLWEYDLNLSPQAVDRLVQHIWELGPTYANYWYLSENCSYHMLTLLEAADSSLELSSKLKKWVIPTDTVHVIWDTENLVKEVHFRASVRSELYARLEKLSEPEKNWVSETVTQQKMLPEIEGWPSHRRQLALDAAIDDTDFTYPRNVQIRDSAETKFKNLLLTARANIPEISVPLNIAPPMEEVPHSGHGSRRWGVGYLTDSNLGNGINLRYRFAFHDLIDPPTGYPDSAKISFFDMNFNYLQNYQKFELNQFSLFEVVSITPYSAFSKNLSWRLNLGFESLVNPSCTGCRAFVMTGGPGYTLNLAQKLKTNFYAGIKGGLYYTSDSSGLLSDGTLPRFLLGFGPNFLIKTTWTPKLISIVEAWYRKDSRVSYQEYKELSLSAQWSPDISWGLRVSAIQRWFENQGSIDLLVYY